MKYRELGKTGISVSEISLGCLGFEGMERDNAVQFFGDAIDRGVNFLDMLSCDPRWRDNFGAALKGKRDKVFIQGHTGAAWVNDQYLRTRDINLLKPAFEDMLTRLGTDYIDVLMVHYVDGPKDWMNVSTGPVMEWLMQLKQEGRIHHIGMSSHNADVSISAVESGLIDVLMFAMNPAYDVLPPATDDEEESFGHQWDETYVKDFQNFDPQHIKLYDLCKNRGVGIDVMKVFGNGNLLDPELSPFEKALSKEQCVHYCLTRPAVAAIMVGCKSTEELDGVLHYYDATDEERDFSKVLSSIDRFTFLGHCMYCGHCAPCPVGIDVASVTKFYNLAASHTTVPVTEKEHYDLLAHHAGECLQCGACETRCPFGVNIRENMLKAAERFGY